MPANSKLPARGASFSILTFNAVDSDVVLLRNKSERNTSLYYHAIRTGWKETFVTDEFYTVDLIEPYVIT